MTDQTITVDNVVGGAILSANGNLDLPLGTIAAGRYLLAFGSIDFKTPAANVNPGVAALSGADTWAEVATPQDPAGAGTTLSGRMWLTKVTTAGDKTVTLTGDSGSRLIGQVYVLNPGAGGTITADGVSAIADRSSPFTFGSLSPAGTADLLVTFLTAYGGGPTLTAPAGMTQPAAGTRVFGSQGQVSAWQSLTAAGATGTRDITADAAYTGGGGTGAMVALRSQGAAPTSPTPIATYTVNATSNTATTVSFTPGADELLVVKAGTGGGSHTISGVSGGSLTYASRSSVAASGTRAASQIWTAPVGSSPSAMTVSVTFGGTYSSGVPMSAVVERWPAGTTVAATPATSSPTNSGTAPPSATVTTTGANSVVTWFDADFGGSTGTATYRTTSATPTQNFIRQVSGAASFYSAYQPAAAAGSQTIGMTAPTNGGAWSMVGVELQAPPAGTTYNASATASMGMSATVGGTVAPTVQASTSAAMGMQVTAGAGQWFLHQASATPAAALTVTAGGTQTSRASAAAAMGLSATAGATQDNAAAATAAAALTFAATALPSRAAAAVVTGALTVSLSPSRGQPLSAAVAAALTFQAAPGLAATATAAAALTVTAGAPSQDVTSEAPVAMDLAVAVAAPWQDNPAAATAVGELTVSASPFWDQRTAAASASMGLTVAAPGVRVVTPTAVAAAQLTATVAAPLRTVMPAALIRGTLSIDAIAVSSAGGALNVKLFGIDRQNGGALVPLPHWSKLDATRQLDGAGAINVEYPVWGRNFWLLQRDVAHDSDLEVEVWLGGRRATRVVGYLQQADGDDVAEAATWQFTGVDMCGRTDEVIVYPQAVVGVADLGSEVAVPQSTVTTGQWTQLLTLGYTGRDGDTVPTVYAPQLVVNAVKAGTTIPVKADDQRELKFNATTPGAILNIVTSQARARGAFTDITLDFTAATDSNGTPWPQAVTAKWSPGTTLTSILDRLVELGLVDWDITPDKVLRLFVLGTSGHLYTAGQSAVRLRRGVNLAEATHRASAREATTAVLAAGSGGLYSDTKNVSAQARRGRRVETYTTAGNIVDTDSLLGIAQRAASLGAYGPDERTFAIAMGTGNPRPGPGQTFDKADTLLLDTTGTGAWIQARVAQWAVSVDPNGATGNVVVGDLISSKAAAILKRLTDTGDGSVVVGTSPTGVDTGIPRPPEGLVVGSAAFAGGPSGADQYASVTAGWQAVVYNTDNTACTDLAGYRVEWRQDGTTAWLFAADVPAGSTQGSWTTACHIPIYARVRAYDTSGNSSAWTTLISPHTTDDDATPPGVPSTPVCSNWLGTLRLSWNGKDVNGADMYAAYPDLEVVRVHMSQASNFTPTDATQVDLIYGAGSYTYTAQPGGATLSYDTTYYFKLVAEDRRGNRSAPSGQEGATPGRIFGPDVFDGAVGSAKLADLAVIRAKIANLAVGDGQVESLGVGKLTAGTLQASMIVGTGKISTGSTGSRVEMDSAGLRLYNAAGTLNVNLKTADGSALVAGEYRTTNASTARIVINPGGGSPAEMQFFPASTAQYARIKVLTSVALGYEDQAGITMKAYSGRSDKVSGEVSAFPSYASIAWADEMDGGAVNSRIAAAPGQAFIAGTKIDLSYGSGGYGWFGRAINNAYQPRTLIRFGPRDGADNSNAAIGATNQHSFIQFDTGSISVVNDGTFIDINVDQVIFASERSWKDDIEPAPLDPVEVVRAADWYRYTKPGKQVPGGPECGPQLGLMLDELPDEVVRWNPDMDRGGVSGYGLTAILWGLGRQHIAQIERLEREVDDLRARLDPPRLAVA